MLSAAGLFMCVWPFGRHHALKGQIKPEGFFMMLGSKALPQKELLEKKRKDVVTF